MKKLITMVALPLVAIQASGCSYVAKDLRHPGGAVGGVLDTRMFDASRSKDLVLLRATILAAMVARAGTVYARDDGDAEAYVQYLAGTADEINILAGHVESESNSPSNFGQLGCDFLARPTTPFDPSTNPELQEASTQGANTPLAQTGQDVAAGDGDETSELSPQDYFDMSKAEATDPCVTYTVNFESDLPMFERRLFRLAVAALPQEEAKKFVDQISGGSFLGAASAAITFSVKAMDGLHSGAAVNRTGLEVLVRNYEKTGVDCANAKKIDGTVWDAAECMGLPRDQLFVGKHDDRMEYNPEVEEGAFRALLANMRDSCLMIPLATVDLSTGKGLAELREDRLKLCNRVQYRPRGRWENPLG